MPHPLSTPLDPWDTRFGFYWYNDHEIFHATQDDLNRQAEAYAKAGVNHVITFSVTHFRWAFRRHWPVITDALERVVSACHRHGIRVTEHHSCHLTYNPATPEEEEAMVRGFRLLNSSIDSWPGFREDCDADPIIDGVPFSSFRQIDGRTGHWARSNYRGWCLCFNNPDFRRAYLAYLETLYAVGIDGIMTDDVQWFGRGHSCACAHCRRLFREQTGYDLPPPGPDWTAWHENYDEPSYVAWLDFRFRSNEDFHQAVKDHYDGLGLRPLRPNYISDTLNRNRTAYTLDALPDLDWVFQECCFEDVIRYSWPAWSVEIWHRFAVGRRRGIPAMAMFYPDRRDTVRFGWALAMSWGVMYLATAAGFSMNEDERALRSFEKAHARLLRGQRRMARIGFYDCRRNRDLYRDAEPRSLAGMKTWMQACYRRNVPFDIFQQEELDRLGTYEVAVLNEVALLSDEEIEAFRSFVINGGTLVWTGRTGALDEHGVRRPEGFVATVWGEGVTPVSDGGESVTHRIGVGHLTMVAGDFGLGPFEPLHHARGRGQETETRIPFRGISGTNREIWRQITDTLEGLLSGGPDMRTENLPGDVTLTPFVSEDGHSAILHILNAAGTLNVSQGEQVGHSDPIPFPAHAGPPARIRLRKPEALAGRAATWARYHDPDRETSVEVPVSDQGTAISVEIDPVLVQAYGLVEVNFSS